MNGRCTTDPLDHADDVCEFCGEEFCEPCLIRTNRGKGKPVCRECALTNSGVRGSRASVSRPSRSQLKAARADLQRSKEQRSKKIFQYFDDEESSYALVDVAAIDDAVPEGLRPDPPVRSSNHRPRIGLGKRRRSGPGRDSRRDDGPGLHEVGDEDHRVARHPDATPAIIASQADAPTIGDGNQTPVGGGQTPLPSLAGRLIDTPHVAGAPVVDRVTPRTEAEELGSMPTSPSVPNTTLGTEQTPTPPLVIGLPQGATVSDPFADPTVSFERRSDDVSGQAPVISPFPTDVDPFAFGDPFGDPAPKISPTPPSTPSTPCSDTEIASSTSRVATTVHPTSMRNATNRQSPNGQAPASADRDAEGNWIPPLLRGMADDAAERATELPHRRRR